MKLKWKIGEKPTGRYRSFQQRSWPSADYEDGTYAGCLFPVEPRLSYHVRIAETTELRVHIALHNTGSPGWGAVRLKQTFVGVTAAKQALSDYLDAHPEAWPNRQTH